MLKVTSNISNTQEKVKHGKLKKMAVTNDNGENNNSN